MPMADSCISRNCRDIHFKCRLFLNISCPIFSKTGESFQPQFLLPTKF
jgi:hypothetical protein